MTHQQEYMEWVTSLPNKRDPNYYDNLIRFAAIIHDDLTCGKYKQNFIANKIQMSSPKLSTIKPILAALATKGQ